ncbi:unnamed protein product [Tetraodon nigroviridis]|uniref:Transmembrane protein 107 n=1 Tax=Tetraodon nigroviridis TaxID=99883 RepID=Q4RIB9_TETNG|nr:unnamed protein product [Tetraodon nigroviridis]
MPAVSSLVPARFLTIIAHLVIVITIFWSRENNVRAGLPLDFTQEQYDSEDRKLVIALAVTIGMFAIELAGFFSGVSMFNCSQGLLSTGTHASASVALLFFLFEQWECDIYWWIFVICRSVRIYFFQTFFFPDWNYTQHWLSTAALQCPCPFLSLRSGSVGHIGLYLPFAVCFLLVWRFFW